MKKVYGSYKLDSSKPVPKRTLMRQRTRNFLRELHADDDIYSDVDIFSDDGIDVVEDESSTSNEHFEIQSNQDGLVNTLSQHDFHYEHPASPQASTLNHHEDKELNKENNSSDNSDDNSDRTTYSSCGLSSDDTSSDNSIFSDVDETLDMKENEYYDEKDVKTWCSQSYVMRHNLSGDAVKHLTMLISIWRDDNHTPKISLKNQESSCKMFHYCSKCNALYTEDPDEFICTTQGCANYRYKGGLCSQTMLNRQPKTSFILANVESQLKFMLEKKGIWDSVQAVKQRTCSPNVDGNIRDIHDGDYYQFMCKPGNFLSGQYNLSAILNTDGIPLYSSSKVKLWPIFLAINELPIAARFSRENLILAGIWQGKGNPPFLQYMWAFGKQMTRLHANGVKIRLHNSNEDISVKLAVLCGTVDLQAKGYILNMTMHNGAYGRSTCEEESSVESQGKGYARFYPYRPDDEKPNIRNDNEIKFMTGPQATRTKRIKGICGISGLSVMPLFDLVNGIVPDYMHGVLMGVTKKLLYLWFSPTSAGQPYFMGKHLTEISSRLLNICPPDYVERLPRNLEKHYGNFKATELQSWLLFYAPACMKNFLPEQYFSHLCIFSEAIYLLLGDNITRSEVQHAEKLLNDFYEQFSVLYKKGSCGLNVHNVGAHLCHFVRLWGPLWAWSCFSFEDANAAILQSVHGTGDVTKQCIRVKELELQMKAIDLQQVRSELSRKFLSAMTHN